MVKVVFPYLRVLVAEVRGGCRRVEVLFSGNGYLAPSFYARSENTTGEVEIRRPANPKDFYECIELATVMAETGSSPYY